MLLAPLCELAQTASKWEEKIQTPPAFGISVEGHPAVPRLHPDMSQTFLTCFRHTFTQYAGEEKIENAHLCSFFFPPSKREKLTELQHIVARQPSPTFWCGETEKQRLIKNLKGWCGSECMSVKTHKRQLINFEMDPQCPSFIIFFFVCVYVSVSTSQWNEDEN